MIKKITFTLLVSLSVFSLKAQSPGNVSTNLRLWLKADVGVTGTSPVSEWEDQSAMANDPATAPGNAPDLLSDQINFNPALDFTRSNSEYLQITNGILGADSYTDAWVYYVSKPNSTSVTNTIFYEVTTGTDEGFGALNTWSDSEGYFYFGDPTNAGGGRLSGNIGTAAGIFNLWTMGTSTGTSTPNGTNKTISKDGLVVLSSNTSDNTVDGNSQDFYIGGRFRATNSHYFDGQLAELIIYDGIPSALEQEKVQSYLAIKYGISKASSDNLGTVGQDERDYFDSGGAVIWDYTANSAYNEGITAIGRDDDSDLSQQRSKSNNSDGAVTMDKGGIFGSDKDFLFWSNNGAITTSTDVPAGYNIRSNRIWKIDLSGTPGAVSFTIDLAAAGLENTGNAGDYALLIDTDDTFSSGATAHTAGASLVGNELSFTAVTFCDGDLFALAINSSTSLIAPGSVTTNLRLWLKADAGITGSSPVSAWTDQSALGNDASTPANGPDLLTAQLNFNPALDFTRSNSEYLQITNGILGNGSYTEAWVYYVSKPVSTSVTNTLFYEELSGTNDGFSSLNTWSDGNTYYDFGSPSNGGRLSGSAGTSAGTFSIWTMSSSSSTSTPNGTNKHISRDGVVVLSGNTNDPTILGTNQNFFIGGRFQEKDLHYLDGQIAELIVYTGLPTTLEQEKVQSYLALKYGITKASADNTTTVGQDEQDYFDSNGSVIWDHSANSLYANGVAGIGRDDNSGLDQRQSRSHDSDAILSIGLDDSGSPDGLEATNQLNDGSFSTDKTFLIWGHDGACVECTEARDNTEFDNLVVSSRFNREWKVEETGSTGILTLEFDLSGLPGPGGTGSNDDDQVVLLVDADGDFSTGASMVTQSFVTTNDDKAIFRTDLTDGIYFTLASGESNALPVRLLSFNAEQTGNEVSLNWVTSSESDNSFFRIERAGWDLDFESIATLNGAGDAEVLNSYNYTDTAPLIEDNYYRLIDVDSEGLENTSEVIKVRFLYESIEKISVYPNPLKRGSRLNLRLKENLEGGQVRVYDDSGTLNQSLNLPLILGKSDITLATEELLPGYYMLIFITPKGDYMKKRIIIEPF